MTNASGQEFPQRLWVFLMLNGVVFGGLNPWWQYVFGMIDSPFLSMQTVFLADTLADVLVSTFIFAVGFTSSLLPLVLTRWHKYALAKLQEVKGSA